MHYSHKQFTPKRRLLPGERKALLLLWFSSFVPIVIPALFIPYLLLLTFIIIFDIRSFRDHESSLKQISFEIHWPDFIELNRPHEINIHWNHFDSYFHLKIFSPAEFSPRIHSLDHTRSSFKLRGKKKGTYSNIELYIGYPSKLGLFTNYRKLTHERNIFVSPPILYLSMKEQYYQGKMNRRLHLEGESDFRGIREYQLGDPIKNINWKKTAGSSNQIYVNQYQKEQNRKVLIVLNTGIFSRFDYRKYQYIDHQVALAFQLAHTFIKNQDETGLLTFSDEIDLYIPPDLSKKHLPVMFHYLQRVEESYKHMNLIHLHLFLKNHLQRNSILILLSPFLSFQQIYSQRKIIYLLNKNYQVIWVNPMRLFRYYYERSKELSYLWARVHLLKEKQEEFRFFRHNRLTYIHERHEDLYQKIVTSYFSLKW